jgi:hypothetical protein
MLTYNSLLLTLVIEGLTKSYVIPKTMDKYKLDETGTFWISLVLLACFSVFEFFFLSKCLNSETIGNVTEQNAMGELFLLIMVALIVNYKWFIKIYKHFGFWSTVGILSVVGFVNEFNNEIINSILRSITGTECSNAR